MQHGASPEAGDNAVQHNAAQYSPVQHGTGNGKQEALEVQNDPISEKTTSVQELHLKVDRGAEEEVTIDLVGVASHMKRKRRLYGYLLLMAVCLGVFIGGMSGVLGMVTGKGAYATAVVTFSYDGIDQGLDPNGGAFDAAQMKSTAVVTEALDMLDWADVSADEVRVNINIKGVIPDAVKQRIAVINTVAEEDPAYYANIEDLDYFPSQYTVTLQRMEGLDGGRTRELLDAVLTAYRGDFMERYANTSALALSSNVLSITEYDYLQAADLLRSQLDVISRYASGKVAEAADFRATSTGLSFADLTAAVGAVSGIDIANFVSFVQSNNLTKDAGTRANYYDYQIEQYELTLAELQARLHTLEGTIAGYEKDPVIVMSSQESVAESSQKNGYYDTLLAQKLSLDREIAETGSKLNETYALRSRLEASTSTGTEEDYAYADKLLSDLSETIESLSGLAELTAREYYETELYADAYRVSIPAQYTPAVGLTEAARRAIICAAALAGAVVVLWCFDGFKEELMKGRGDGKEV